MDINISSSSISPSFPSSLFSSLNTIPSELLCDQNVFESVINDNNVWSLINATKQQELLNKHLPDSLDKREKNETVQMLFSHELKRFESDPLENVYFHLKIAKISPETLEEINRLKRKAYFIEEQERQCKLLNEVLTRRRILFQLSADSSPHGLKRVTFFDRNSPLIKEITRSMHEHRKAVRRAVKTKERFRAEMKQLFPDYSTSDEDDDLNSDSRNISLFGIQSFSNPKSTKTKSDTLGLQEEYINLLKKHRRKRKALNDNSSDEYVMDISNITLNDVISRVANDSDESIANPGSMGKFTPFGEGKIISSICSSKPLSSSNFTLAHPSKKKSKSTKSVNKITTPHLPPPSIHPASSMPLPSLNNSLTPQPSTSLATAASIDFPSILTHSSSSLPCNAGLSSIKKTDKLTSPSSTNTINPAHATSTSIKRELDIFDFDSESPPHSLVLPPLSLSLSASNSQPPTVTSFTSLLNQPPPPQATSIMSDSLKSLPDFSASTSSSLLLPNTFPPTTTSTAASSVTNSVFTSPATPTATTNLVTNNLNSVSQPAAEIYKPAPSSFFALLRDIFYVHAPNDYRLTLHKVEELAKEKIRELDPKLGWTHEMVQSAMNHLSGVLPPPEMIPLVDYKEKNQQWQWIGVSRDSDEVLSSLCRGWLEELDKNRTSNNLDPSQSIPPAICPTTWSVRATTEEEKRIYREQEALRYQNPHKAFTFKVHGYTSVVGPVKGCSTGSATHTASPNKAREHSLLVSDRPPFVTLLSLVRDAAARLPNGEGTRADICELLRDSQYILPNVSDHQVNGIVSGALDRLHYEKDPCVKYDVNRKVWIYLHRNRTEEEFERLHEVQMAAAKAKRSLGKTQRKLSNPPPNKQASAASTSTPPITAPLVAGSNTATVDNEVSNPLPIADSLLPITTPPPQPTSISLPSASAISLNALPNNVTEQSPEVILTKQSPQIEINPDVLLSAPIPPLNWSSTPGAGNNGDVNSKKKLPRPKIRRKNSWNPESTTESTLTKSNAFSNTAEYLSQQIQTPLPPVTSTSTEAGSALTTIPVQLDGVSTLFSASKGDLANKPNKPLRPLKTQINTMKVMPIYTTVQNIPITTQVVQTFSDGSSKQTVSTSNSSSPATTPLLIAATSPQTLSISTYGRTYTTSSIKQSLQTYSNIQPQLKPLISTSTLAASNSIAATFNQPINPNPRPAPSQSTVSSALQTVTQTVTPLLATTIQGSSPQVKREDAPRRISALLPARPIDQRPHGKVELTMRTPNTNPTPISITRIQTPPSPSTPTQITIPTSVLFGTRPGSVVLTTGKSYMMATSGGSIVLQPQITTNQSGIADSSATSGTLNNQSMAVRTYPIRVIPVTSQRATVSGASSTTASPQVVARIITTTNQPARGVTPQAQIVVPPTSLQPILLASQQLPNRND